MKIIETFNHNKNDYTLLELEPAPRRIVTIAILTPDLEKITHDKFYKDRSDSFMFDELLHEDNWLERRIKKWAGEKQGPLAFLHDQDSTGIAADRSTQIRAVPDEQKTELDEIIPCTENHYKMGVRNGHWREWWRTGALRLEGFCVNGELDKTVTEFYPNGSVMEVQEYDHGKHVNLPQTITKDLPRFTYMRFQQNGELYIAHHEKAGTLHDKALHKFIAQGKKQVTYSFLPETQTSLGKAPARGLQA